ncbi:YraN family protein [Labrys sp. LIt4]|uniref:YraN family protein n=1 Tax=Labrys sp. LIt4 TaxID=2821355 RepID=UPI001ADF2180|nr:YraN family protein [Labrys sp. LIt4]MBP0577747.1 YraN family protein [Labrys sp. LIt4]
MSKLERQAAFRAGLNAETRAGWLLRLKGYRLLARRFKVPGGEIDLIARRGGTLVFVEVKARAEVAVALEAITPGQQRRIATAARAWLARHPDHAALTQRFDAVFVTPWHWPRHQPNWFEMDLG